MSLLVLILLVAPEVGYQSGTLGLIFLFAAIPVLFASLIDWRFGIGAFLTLFLAPLGLSFVIPVFLAMIFSLYIGLAVAVAGGLLVALFVTLGNLPILGYLAGPGANGTPSLIAGHAAALQPTLPFPYFTFTQVGSAYANMLSPNPQVLSLGGSGLGLIAIPIIEVGAWCFAAWIVTWALREREHQTPERLLQYSGRERRRARRGDVRRVLGVQLRRLVGRRRPAVRSRDGDGGRWVARHSRRIRGVLHEPSRRHQRRDAGRRDEGPPEDDVRDGGGTSRREGRHQGVDDHPADAQGRHDALQARAPEGDPTVRPAPAAGKRC